MGAGARAGLRERVGRRPPGPAPRVQRRRGAAAQGRPPRRPAREGVLRLYGALLLPAASRRRPRRLPAVREPGLAGKMTPPPEDESTGLPGLRSWSGVYWGVVGVLAAWVAFLAVLTRVFS